MTHQVQWTAAAPLWDEAARSSDDEIRGQFRRPSILRFATDTFMEDFLALLDTNASRVAELVTQPETWRDPIAAVKRPPIDPVTSFARTLARFRVPGGRVRTLPPAAGGPAAAVLRKPDLTKTLKLYQPAHQRHYLVSACLVCKQAALPDRALDTTREERVTFVMRRLLGNGTERVSPDNPSTYDEFAFVTTAEGTGWQKVLRTSTRDPGALVPGEEQLPLFQASYLQDDGRKRRLLTGTVPVGRREAYLGAPPLPLPEAEQQEPVTDAPTVSGKPPLGAREILLRSQVIEPWKQLIARAELVRSMLNTGESPDKFMTRDDADKLVRDTRFQIQTGSWYVLLDFAKYLKTYLPDVWTHISTSQTPVLSPAEITLLAELKNIKCSAAFVAQLVTSEIDYQTLGGEKEILLTEALKRIALEPVEKMLDSITTGYIGEKSAEKTLQWPSFLFPLADPGERVEPPHVEGTPFPPVAGPTLPLHADRATAVNILARFVDAALPTTTTSLMPERALGARPIAGIGEPAWFVIRCVYERPRCGPLEPAVISEPTSVFQLAAFFDPDAPARPIRIGLPIDTSQAGLRKFDKNTAFAISDILCGQIGRVRKLTLGDLVLSVLPWPFHKDLPEGKDEPCSSGMVCSFSLPIVTICALLLLIIFVTVLDSIFHWLPWFFICYPLPGFKAKET